MSWARSQKKKFCKPQRGLEENWREKCLRMAEAISLVGRLGVQPFYISKSSQLWMRSAITLLQIKFTPSATDSHKWHPWLTFSFLLRHQFINSRKYLLHPKGNGMCFASRGPHPLNVWPHIIIPQQGNKAHLRWYNVISVKHKING